MNKQQGSYYVTRLPTSHRTKNSKKKVLKKHGDKLNYQITKCPVCSKRKMEKYNVQDSKGELILVNQCKNCKFLNASSIAVYKAEYPHTVTYYNPPPIEDKS